MRAGFVEAARKMVGTPFAHQGRQPDVGLDCVGLIFCSAWSAGLDLENVNGYGRAPDGQWVRTVLAEYCDEIAEPESGDIVLFAIQRGHSQHCGIVDGPHVIHAYGSKGRVVRHRLEGAWSRRVDSYWRLRWRP